MLNVGVELCCVVQNVCFVGNDCGFDLVFIWYQVGGEIVVVDIFGQGGIDVVGYFRGEWGIELDGYGKDLVSEWGGEL